MNNLPRPNSKVLKPEETIAGYFESVVHANPQRIAIVDAGKSMTFGQLNANVNDIAQLIRYTMRVDDRPVASLLSLGNSRYIEVMLAAIKAGCIYAVLPSDLGRADIEKRLAHSNAQLILTDNQHVELIDAGANSDLYIINVDEEQEQPAENLCWKISPDSPAILSYTSGSTGSPKGIVHTHRSVLAFVKTYIDRIRLDTHDRVGILRGGRGPDLLSSLLRGSCAHLYDLQSRGFVGLGIWLNEHEISVLPAAPTMLRVMMTSFRGAIKIPTVRLLRLSGEPLYARDLEQAANIFSSDCEVMNWFGSTEVAVASRVFRLDEESTGLDVPVGEVFDGIEVKIINDEGQEVEVGEVGEIVIQGRHLFAGYWNDSESTSAVLKPDHNNAGTRLFYSGDLGAFNQSGLLVLSGRKDSQINLRGYRIEPEEIELALSQLDGIDAALVTLVEVSMGDESNDELAAYVVISRDPPPSVRELRRLLIQELPLYKIPGYFVHIPRLPRLPGGKYDRNSLPKISLKSRLGYNTPS